MHDSLPDGEEGRCVLLPEDSEHWVCPFDDAESGKFTHRTPRSLGKMIPNTTRLLADFHGREVRHTRWFVFRGGGWCLRRLVQLRAANLASEDSWAQLAFCVTHLFLNCALGAPSIQRTAAQLTFNSRKRGEFRLSRRTEKSRTLALAQRS